MERVDCSIAQCFCLWFWGAESKTNHFLFLLGPQKSKPVLEVQAFYIKKETFSNGRRAWIIMQHIQIRLCILQNFFWRDTVQPRLIYFKHEFFFPACRGLVRDRSWSRAEFLTPAFSPGSAACQGHRGLLISSTTQAQCYIAHYSLHIIIWRRGFCKIG